MTRKLPPVATAIVLAAVATMIALGVWQLQRADEKGALLERYRQAQAMSPAVEWPDSSDEYERSLYRHARIDCAQVTGMDAVAGRSAEGQTGWAHVARCQLPDGGEARVAIGWSSEPRSPQWAGGEVGGFIGPAGEGVRLVAAPAQAGLAQLAAPDPNDLPNNHLAYAFQWFFFALTALAIYWLALRRKWRDGEAG
ncbi:MAG: SURF1 family cytochrome oxidase biogenesis protein [Croceibacterium sp.]